ncbi:sulfopyruvate decarboxylase subunit alpha [Geoglobus acetivorans]|uniref:sulfopyruvate decarboxylase n=1 Tax=Geoglobus acetivorans TaxID=565033 RepID=A0ABZ3H2Z7_GEOAI|nr:sulfopyruvate decarboxylase subunit alpha [Geoglobus acetivorans]
MIEDEVIDRIKSAGITHTLFLPCERIKLLISKLQDNFKSVPLSREEEGVGISAGLYLAGQKPLMVIQSSGFGNMVNALLSLTETYRLPLPILISWRGVFGEKIDAQKPMGRKIRSMLNALGIHYTVFDGNNSEDIENTISTAYEENKITAILLRPDVWSMGEDLAFEPRSFETRKFEVPGGKARYTRYELIQGMKEFLEGKIVVSNIGYPSRELYHVIDQPSNFYMLGSMGLATSIALGINLTGKEVISIDGDGSILMNPSTIFTAGLLSEEGLKVIAIDNSAYGSTGNQTTATIRADLSLLGISAGLETFRTVTPDQITLHASRPESMFIHALAKPGNARVGTIPLSPEEIRDRFMEAIK